MKNRPNDGARIGDGVGQIMRNWIVGMLAKSECWCGFYLMLSEARAIQTKAKLKEIFGDNYQCEEGGASDVVAKSIPD